MNDTRLEDMPLGQIRAVVDRRLDEFTEASGKTPGAIWEEATIAKNMPEEFSLYPEGEDFWTAFEALRKTEAKRFLESR